MFQIITLFLVIHLFYSSNFFGQEFIKTQTGLQYYVVKKGEGKKIINGNKVYVQYVGKLENDIIFDSNVGKEPFVFTVGERRVIAGFEEAILQLNEGDSAIIIIPPHLGYGNRQVGVIPPNSTLKFFIKILKVEKAEKISLFECNNNDTIYLENGLKYLLIERNLNEKKIAEGDIVEIEYIGYFPNWEIFDSSIKRKQPLRFEVGKKHVIYGLEKAILHMYKGDKARIFIPFEYAYGAEGKYPTIPPKTNLVFDVFIKNIYTKIKPVPFNCEGKDTLQLPSGLKYIIVEKSNSGIKPQPKKKVKVHYTGYFTDGKIFDSSLERGFPFEFVVGANLVIKGWEEGILLMEKGDKFRFIIPYHLAYGEEGFYNIIPPKSTLIFDIELIDVEN